MKKFTSQRWICVQDTGDNKVWWYEPSIKYTRTESIKACMEGGTLTWDQLKYKFGWRCIRVTFELTPITKP